MMTLFVALIVPIRLVAQTQNYVITNFGTLGGTSSAAVSITDSGGCLQLLQ
jgi:hypothetical protein